MSLGLLPVPAIDSVKLVVGAAVLAVILAVGIGGYLHARQSGAESVRAELAPKLATLKSELNDARDALAAAEIDRLHAEEASREYQFELQGLRDRPVDRRPVRLCLEPAARPPTQAPAAGLAGAATVAGSVSGAAGGDSVPGPDIGPDLRALAYDADALSARLRALQRYCASDLEPAP